MTPEPADEQNARRFEAVRSANRSETVEDYVEAIDDFLAQNGEARVRDLAGPLRGEPRDRQQDGGAPAARRPRGDRALPLDRADARGPRDGRRSRARHAQVLALLLSLGIEPEVAEQDAEGIEHHVGPDTLAAFARFVAARGRVPDAAPPTPAAADPERFARVRRAHASEVTEDYVEAIGDHHRGVGLGPRGRPRPPLRREPRHGQPDRGPTSA